jgi:hypothetical protein
MIWEGMQERRKKQEEEELRPYFEAIAANESLKKIIDFILIYSNVPVTPEIRQAYTLVRSYIEDQVLFHDPDH